MFTPQDVACPVGLLKRYCAHRDGCHGASVEALFVTEDGSAPTWSWFDKRFFAILDRAYGGHSLRAGGAMYYVSLGLLPKIIMALGRWSSKAWRMYVRNNPAVRAKLALAEIAACCGAV